MADSALPTGPKKAMAHGAEELVAVMAEYLPHRQVCGLGEAVAAAWVVDAVAGGLSRVFAIRVEDCVGLHCRPSVIRELERREVPERVVRAIDDYLMAAGPDVYRRGPLAQYLSNALYSLVDKALEQLTAASSDLAATHGRGVRIGHQVVILFDRDSRFDWLYSAAAQRVRTELIKVGLDPRAALIQEVDLAGGGRLSLPGFDVVAVRGRPTLRVCCEPVRLDAAPLETVRKPLGVQNHNPPQCVGQNGGWRRLLTKFMLIEWLRPLQRLRSLQEIQLTWQVFPKCVGVGWQLLGQNRAMAAGGSSLVLAMIALGMLTYDVYGDLSGESPAYNKPSGFYIGQYNQTTWWSDDRVSYGLYIPLHLSQPDPPRPLIVFLHGYGTRTPDLIFAAGVPRAISTRFGDGRPGGRFEFIALFPNDPTGMWEPGTPEVDAAMTVLDFVIRRHRIDPDRVYLTGASNGGSGVWRLAEAYPSRWAAVAPVAAFYQPDPMKVHHLPMWVFHGENDRDAPVAPVRKLVRQLHADKADVQYSEVAEQGHLINTEVYSDRRLYDWLSNKRRNTR